MDRGAWWLQTTGSQESDATEGLSSSTSYVQNNPTNAKKTWGAIHHTADCEHLGARAGGGRTRCPWETFEVGTSGCCGQEHTGLVQLEDRRQPLLRPQ